jgi:mono/diheme cytochrome c family protein
MSRPRLTLLAASVVLASTTVAFAQDAKTDPKIERGRYLAEEVARCQECHTPLLPNGEFDKTQWMKGATLVGIPATAIPDWHQKAPDITSTAKLWEKWKVEGFVKFLSTGKTPRGGKSGPPMPAYKLKVEDAEAVTAYLKSLP